MVKLFSSSLMMNLDLMEFFSRNNLPATKDEVYVINLDDKNRKGTQWFSLFLNTKRAVYFDSFGIKYIPPEVLKKSKINQLLTIYEQHMKIMNLLYVDFIVSL